MLDQRALDQPQFGDEAALAFEALAKLGDRREEPRFEVEAPANPERSGAASDTAVLMPARGVIACTFTAAPAIADRIDADAVTLAQWANPDSGCYHGVRSRADRESIDRDFE